MRNPLPNTNILPAIKIFADEASVERVIRGMRRLKLRLRTRTIAKGLMRGARLVTKAARAAVPVKTGALKETIRAKAARANRRGLSRIDVFVFAGHHRRAGVTKWAASRTKARTSQFGNVRYAHIVEGKKPYMEPSLKQSYPAIVKSVSDAIDAELKKLEGFT